MKRFLLLNTLTIGLLFLLYACISTATQQNSPDSSVSQQVVYSPVEQRDSNVISEGEDGERRECETVADVAIRRDLLAAINKLRRQGCMCGVEEMPKVKELKWNESFSSIAANLSGRTQAGIQPLTEVGVYMEQEAFQGTPLYLQNEGAEQVRHLMIAIQLRADQCKLMMNKKMKTMGASKVGCYWTVMLE